MTAKAIGDGPVGAAAHVLVPYTGINQWVRTVIVLGAAVLLLDAALLLAFAPRALGDLRRAGAALPLVALAVVPSTLVHPAFPYLQGLVLFALLAAFMWGERIRRQRARERAGAVRGRRGRRDGRRPGDRPAHAVAQLRRRWPAAWRPTHAGAVRLDTALRADSIGREPDRAVLEVQAAQRGVLEDREPRRVRRHRLGPRQRRSRRQPAEHGRAPRRINRWTQTLHVTVRAMTHHGRDRRRRGEPAAAPPGDPAGRHEPGHVVDRDPARPRRQLHDPRVLAQPERRAARVRGQSVPAGPVAGVPVDARSRRRDRQRAADRLLPAVRFDRGRGLRSNAARIPRSRCGPRRTRARTRSRGGWRAARDAVRVRQRGRDLSPATATPTTRTRRRARIRSRRSCSHQARVLPAVRRGDGAAAADGRCARRASRPGSRRAATTRRPTAGSSPTSTPTPGSRRGSRTTAGCSSTRRRPPRPRSAATGRSRAPPSRAGSAAATRSTHGTSAGRRRSRRPRHGGRRP